MQTDYNWSRALFTESLRALIQNPGMLLKLMMFPFIVYGLSVYKITAQFHTTTQLAVCLILGLAAYKVLAFITNPDQRKQFIHKAREEFRDCVSFSDLQRMREYYLGGFKVIFYQLLVYDTVLAALFFWSFWKSGFICLPVLWTACAVLSQVLIVQANQDTQLLYETQLNLWKNHGS